MVFRASSSFNELMELMHEQERVRLGLPIVFKTVQKRWSIGVGIYSATVHRFALSKVNLQTLLKEKENSELF